MHGHMIVEFLKVTKAGGTYSNHSALRTATIPIINFSKTESNLHNAYRFSSYLIEKHSVLKSERPVGKHCTGK